MTTLYYIALALIIFGAGFKIGTAIMREKLEETNEEWFKISEGWRELCKERGETIEELTERLERKGE